MTSGLVCISVTGRTAAEFLSEARIACAKAPAVELRFDSLPPDDLPKVVDGIADLRSSYEGIIIGTLRSSADGQGGGRHVSANELENFWNDRALKASVDWIDLGPNELPNPPSEYSRIIRSFHSFEGCPESSSLESIRKRLSGSDTRNIPKIACGATEITDAIPLWNLQGIAEPIIAIAMGEFGIWTRILSLSKGAPLAYASSRDGAEAAPGQASFEDLISIYRADGISEQTRIYGIVGLKSSGSLSPYIHNPAFAEKGIDAVYMPLTVRDCREFYNKMVSPRTREIEWNLCGLSVTIPHKVTMAGLVDELRGGAAEIGAVNTVRIEDGRTVGFNTDADGFLLPLEKALGNIKGMRAGIIGSGGAAKAVAFALSKRSADVVIFSRSPKGAREMKMPVGAEIRELSSGPEAFAGLDIIVNASPVGSSGEFENLSPVPVDALQNLQLAYDLVYNPLSTRFLRDAEKAGVPTLGGLEMLIEQAALQFEIWTGRQAPKSVMSAAVRTRLLSK